VSETNRQWLIAARPNNRALQESDFTWVEGAVRSPTIEEVQVRTMYLGFDPAQKGWMETTGGYQQVTEIGDVMRSFGVGQVVASKAPSLKPGDMVQGQLGWQDFATLPARELIKIPDHHPPAAYLGILGANGMTALLGLHHVGRPFPGDTMVITGAAGATGSIVGQIGKIGGCRVVGIAGGPAKCQWLVEELRFDAAIDYKASDLPEKLEHHLAQGIDLLWDNVGGTLLNDLLGRISPQARIVICGSISRNETGGRPVGPHNYYNLLFRRARMEGFGALDYAAEFPWARARIEKWLHEGRLRYREDVQHGLENAPRTLMRLFSGANLGKQILKL
jgi:NADPH-dependent curcumin reductase CurA